MTHRERVLKTLRFERPDRVPCDMMEGVVWPELVDYFNRVRGIDDELEALNYLDTDFRWEWIRYVGPDTTRPEESFAAGSYSDTIIKRPLADATTTTDIEAFFKTLDPGFWQPPDYQATRNAWPEHALVAMPGWIPLFCGACDAFGMEEALVKMHLEPNLFEAFVRRQHEFYMDVLTRACDKAQGIFDICWLGDDYAHKNAMIMNPDLWRKFIKPYLAEHVRLARERGMYVLFHSCGSVRPILPDLIDIGVNALLVFQTSAAGMDTPSIVRDFGGRMAFYGGIDVTHLLTFGTLDEVKAEVRANVEAFRECGGYIVANSHRIGNIRGENMEAMFEAARECTF